MSRAATVSLEGLPQFEAALKRLEKELTGPKGEEALRAAGRVIADEWAQRAPIGEPPHDPHPGAYQRSLQSPDAVFVGREGEMPFVTISPAELAELPYNEQPHAYAGVLEYGEGSRAPQPTARPAFDAAAPEAIDVLEKELKPIAEAVHA